MEPRAYSDVPIGTNFVVLNYARSSGQVLLDPSLPVTDLQAKINAYSIGYSHSFGIAGHTASIAALAPYAVASLTGDVGGTARQAYRSGMGDVRFRFAVILLGSSALLPRDFARRTPTTTLGASLSVVAPTGQYWPTRLINVGANRWAFKPEIGLSQPLGDWFVEGAAGFWIFTDNNDFYVGRRSSQAPLPVFQLHGGYTWRPGLWLAADVTYYTGGRTSVNGIEDQDLQRSVRYGLTLSVPIASQWSAKFSWSKGLMATAGGDFRTYSLALQYRWFNR
ncbi:transporter [Caballeronia sp. RCC_10]|uniref:transporter n=1 Tax=Caballeronia sp. RCC_10 TaxID=3239227 RepID=UPI003526954D